MNIHPIVCQNVVDDFPSTWIARHEERTIAFVKEENRVLGEIATRRIGEISDL